MGLDLKGRRFCDACGRIVCKIQRIEGRDEYCSTCYVREFIVRKCACGTNARVHRSALPPFACRSCEAQRRICVRCDRPVPRAGRRVDGGVVCPSCRPYYLEPTFCGACGKLSRTLTRVKGDSQELKICERCRTAETHATCTHCHRYRPAAGWLSDSQAYCCDCGLRGVASHLCPDCGIQVPGIGSGRCRPCLNRSALDREVALQRSTLTRVDARAWLPEFAAWLHRRAPGDPRLVSDFLKHVPFIARIDSMLDSADHLTEAWLLQHIPVNEARGHLQFMRFLTECHGIELGEDAKLEAVEAQRVAECLKCARRLPYSAVLEAFAEKIARGSYRPRTRRQYVVSAAALCQHAQVSAAGWKPEGVISYLAKRPGQRANLGVFMRFCSEEFGWTVPLLHPPAAPVVTAPTAKRFKALLEKVDAAGEEASFADLERLIEIAFGLRRGGLRFVSVQRTPGHVRLEIEGTCYRVPRRLWRIVERWSAARSAVAT